MGFHRGQIELTVSNTVFGSAPGVQGARAPWSCDAHAHLPPSPLMADTFNAFFMTMRGKFTAPGTSIHYYVVEFDPKTLPWADFRGKVLGPTDPKDAPDDALRGIIAKDWEKLGLKAPCNGGDNAVHASASPFEGLAERTNWLAGSIADDAFGKVLLDKGVPEATIKAWSSDPQVKYDAETAKDTGKEKGSIFDALEDLDLDACLAKCVAISSA